MLGEDIDAACLYICTNVYACMCMHVCVQGKLPMLPWAYQTSMSSYKLALYMDPIACARARACVCVCVCVQGKLGIQLDLSAQQAAELEALQDFKSAKVGAYEARQGPCSLSMVAA